MHSVLFNLVIACILQSASGSYKTKTNCFNGSAEEKCENSGSCRTQVIKDTYFAGGEARRRKAHITTYCACTAMWGGVTCLEPNTCFHTKPCVKNHFFFCIHKSPNGFKCQCRKDWTGKVCESPRAYSLQRKASENPCRSSPCGNAGGKVIQGTCLVQYNSTGHYSGYLCKCGERHTGVHCETLRDCRHENDDCKNGGTCHKSQRCRKVHVCKCPDAFTGFRCENPAPYLEIPTKAEPGPPDSKRQKLSSSSGPCASSPCRAAATCHEIGEEASGLNSKQEPVGYHCECPDDFTVDCSLPSAEDIKAFEHLINSCLLGVNEIPPYLDYLGFDEHPSITHVNTTLRKFRSIRKQNHCTNNGICILEKNKVRCYCPAGLRGKACTIQTGPKVEMKLQFQNRFDKRLLNKSSDEFLELKRSMKQWISTICVDDLGTVCHLADVSFSYGSISANYSVIFGDAFLGRRLAVTKEFRSILRKNAETFPDKSMRVVPHSVKVIKVIQPQTLRKSNERKFLAVAICTGLVFSFILAVVMSFLLMLKRDKRY